MTDPIVRVENLSKVYRSGAIDLTVFSGAQFELRAGESVALVGESGAGKSTLLHLLGALDVPSAGQILYAGNPLSSFSEAELADFRNHEVGYVWQSYHLLPEFSALENVMMPLLIGGVDARQAEPRAKDWLEQVGLADRATHRAGELSGGEQQRISIARALVGGPKLFLADEPTGNLDESTAAAVMSLILDLNQSHKLTTVIATHNLSFARRCQRVFRIEGARVFPLPGLH
jgi:lipoprotein-releasing system ATP-binding protein